MCGISHKTEYVTFINMKSAPFEPKDKGGHSMKSPAILLV